MNEELLAGLLRRAAAYPAGPRGHQVRRAALRNRRRALLRVADVG